MKGLVSSYNLEKNLEPDSHFYLNQKPFKYPKDHSPINSQSFTTITQQNDALSSDYKGKLKIPWFREYRRFFLWYLRDESFRGNLILFVQTHKYLKGQLEVPIHFS